MKGQLVIIATGHTVDNFSEDWELKENKRIKNLVDNLENKDWHLHSSILINAYQLFDCRNSQTKTNRLFCAKVGEALEEGAIIVIPDAKMVDKKLRNQAIIFSLPKGEV